MNSRRVKLIRVTMSELFKQMIFWYVIFSLVIAHISVYFINRFCFFTSLVENVHFFAYLVNEVNVLESDEKFVCLNNNFHHKWRYNLPSLLWPSLILCQPSSAIFFAPTVPLWISLVFARDFFSMGWALFKEFLVEPSPI